MVPRQQTPHPDRQSEGSMRIVDPRTETFRPVALPALAAAVRAARTSTRTSLLSSTRSDRFEHEDTPLS